MSNNNLNINYQNNLDTQKADFNSVASEETLLGSGLVLWQPYGKTVFSNFPENFHAYHALGKLDTMPNIVATPVNARTYQEGGRTKTTINDGLEYVFPLTFRGNDIRNLMAILNVDTFAKQAGENSDNKRPMTRTAIQDNDYGILGNLIVWQAGSDQKLHMSYAIIECGVRVFDASGVGDALTYNVEFYSSKPFFNSTLGRTRVGLGTVIVAEKFYEDLTTFTRGFAPNGTNISFQPGMGTAIGSTQGSLTAAQELTLATTPLNLEIVDYDRAIDDPYRYFLDIRLNGIRVTDSQLVKYDETTGLVEFVEAPALGDVLEWTYALKSGYPDWNIQMNYGVGEYVTYNGNIWASVNPVLGTAPVAPAWEQVMPEPYAYRIPYANGDTTNIKNRVGNLTNPFVRWEIIVSE